MAHFYGEIQGNRGEATRMGSVASGFRWHCRGWNVGSSGYMENRDGEDVAQVNATGGSSGYRTAPLASVRVARVPWGKDGETREGFAVTLSPELLREVAAGLGIPRGVTLPDGFTVTL